MESYRKRLFCAMVFSFEFFFYVLITGRVETGMEDFQGSLKYFKWINLYVVPQTHRALLFVVRECQKVAQMSLFTTSYGKNVTLSEFQEIQTQTTNNVSSQFMVKVRTERTTQ